ncbi:DUF3040 domain-containing protein [Microbacterium thalli]|uniref:DUF3040 domain-containing protein n=1 Tax=Microbacterium thalli TaxID=3027921 RepID=A0ABT5SHV0_9MICO|nr:DUF3040 domain-containing protein [Microbacterium thalli]MDD7930230.1 DUF3040 domain-containing protein [Microbacterium thalli]MDD7962385.1 DUF3040 domain-containing protein [Microbacterium thalli]MDN8549291.1 DUF3040 domain-containing protein [Microbacterium thalli]
MPLSEQEQRLLDEMERHLMRNEADVVSAPRDGQSLSYRNIVYGALLVLLSLGGLIVGVSTGIIAIGVVAFVVMVAGVVLALTPARNGTVGRSAGTAGTKKPTNSSANFMDRMNERWDRRNGER